MSQQPEIAFWRGKSGTPYPYTVHAIDQDFFAVPGNYILSKVVDGRWFAIYIGETSDLSRRFDGHHAAPCVLRHGATHLHVHLTSSNLFERLDEEDDLISALAPPCNR